jgi:C4-dicarboxylate-specific signal transduction histidine kinase
MNPAARPRRLGDSLITTRSIQPRSGRFVDGLPMTSVAANPAAEPRPVVSRRPEPPREPFLTRAAAWLDGLLRTHASAPTRSLIVATLTIDVVLLSSGFWSYWTIIEHTNAELAEVAFDYVLVSCIGFVIGAFALALVMRPAERWLAGGPQYRRDHLVRATQRVHRIPDLSAMIWMLRWTAEIAMMMYLHRPASAMGMVFYITGVTLAIWPLSHLSASWLQGPIVRALATTALAAEIEVKTPRRTYAGQLAAYTVCLVMGPMSYTGTVAFWGVATRPTVPEMLVTMLVYILPIAAYAILCALISASTVVGPLKRMSDALNSITAQPDALEIERLPRERGDEIGDLAEQTNQMIDRLERTSIERSALQHTLEDLNCSLEQRSLDLEHSVTELRHTQHRLVDTARRAGQAEAATGILHNVGNVLNSVTVAAAVARDLAESRSLNQLTRGLDLLRGQPDPAQFLTGPKGPLLLKFLASSTALFEQDQRSLCDELAQLDRHVTHIKAIVGQQQRMARTDSATERRLLSEIVLDALQIDASSHARHHIEIIRELDDTLELEVDTHRMLQILINLFANARDAVKARPAPRRITVRARAIDTAAVIDVDDNGVGIRPDVLPRLFQHGFTTKPDGHGFGLHACLSAAADLGGTLVCSSDGEDRGARFTLTVPLRPPINAPTAAAATDEEAPGPLT